MRISTAGPALRNTGPFFPVEWTVFAGRVDLFHGIFTWGSVDWYGVPKLNHYILQDAFAPLRAIVLFDCLNFLGTPVSLPVWLVDDAGALAGEDWTVQVRVYGSDLSMRQCFEQGGAGAISGPQKVGALRLDWRQANDAPLLTVAEVWLGEALASRAFYWSNVEHNKEWLFSLPKTTLALRVENRAATVENTGPVPAVGVLLAQPGKDDTFLAADNFLWLEPGEKQTIEVNDGQGLRVSALNAGKEGLEG